jgi:hypothetical protein
MPRDPKKAENPSRLIKQAADLHRKGKPNMSVSLCPRTYVFYARHRR